MQYYRGYEISKDETIFSVFEEGELVYQTDAIHDAMLYVDHLYQMETQEDDYNEMLTQSEMSAFINEEY